MRALLVALLSVFLVCPAAGQIVYGEAGTTVPGGSFSFAKTGFQGALIGRVPVAESALDVAGTARVGYNVNGTPQGESRRVTALVGPEVSYTQNRVFVKANLGGGQSIPLGDEEDRAWMLRSRLAVGVETASGRQLSVGPTHGVTTDDRWWFGLSVTFSIVPFE